MFMPERWLFDYAYILYGIAMLLLIAVIVIGKTVYGSKSWLTIGPITFQPSEFGKIATLLAVPAPFLLEEETLAIGAI